MSNIVVQDIVLAEIRTELAEIQRQRRRAHAKWVAAGTMTQSDADRHDQRLAMAITLVDNLAEESAKRGRLES